MTPEEDGGFSRRAVGWIVGVAAGSFLLALLLSAFAEDLGRRPTPHANTFSYSLLGHRAAVELLRSQGLDVVARRTRGGVLAAPDRPLILAEPDPEWLEEVGPERLDTLREEARQRRAAFVLVLPKWRGEPCPDERGWLCSADLVPEERVHQVISASLRGTDGFAFMVGRKEAVGDAVECSAAWGDRVSLQVAAAPLQVFHTLSGFEPVVECPGGALVLRLPPTASSPEIWVVTDPDLLNNQGLGRADHAALLYQLLAVRFRARGAIFDETIHGFSREPGLVSEAFDFPLVLAVLQALVLAGTVLWAGMGRFGKPLAAPQGLALGKTVLLDNTAQLLTQGGDLADSLARYYRQTTRAVAAHYTLSPDLPESKRLEQLRRIAAGRGVRTDPAALLERVRRFPDHKRGAAERAVALAQRIYRWRQEMTDGHPDRM